MREADGSDPLLTAHAQPEDEQFEGGSLQNGVEDVPRDPEVSEALVVQNPGHLVLPLHNTERRKSQTPDKQSVPYTT